MKPTRPAVNTVVAALLIACAYTQTSWASDEPKPQVTLSWLESCGLAQSPYFVIEVFADRYRYRGSPGMRERGEVVRRLPRGDADRLASDVRAHMSDAAKRFAEIPDKREKALTYCIEVRLQAERFTLGDVSSLIGGTTNAQANTELRSLEQVVGRTIDFKELACPTHAYDLTLNAFCGTPTVFFSFTDDEPCGYFHSVDIYDNGDLQYYSLEDPLVDERRKLNRRKLKHLFQVARSFGTSDMVPQLVPDGTTNALRAT